MYYGHGSDAESAERPVTEETPVFRNFLFAGIQCIGAHRALEMAGLPEQPLHNIVFEDIRLRAKKGIFLAYVQDVEIDGLAVEAGDEPLFSIHNCRGIRIAAVEGQKHTDAVLQASGKRTTDIRLEGFEPGRLKVTAAAETDASGVAVVPLVARRA
jgi:hypothetical protein